MGDICVSRRKRTSLPAGSVSFTSSGVYDLANYGLKVGHVIDIFLVGGGGGLGGSVSRTNTDGTSRGCDGGYGGSGYTYTKKSITLTSTIITVTIGQPGQSGTSGSDNDPTFSGASNGQRGGSTYITVNGVTYEAAGGYGGLAASGYGDNFAEGGNGGSGGSFGYWWYYYTNGSSTNGGVSQGGIDGSDSPNNTLNTMYGKGQGTTTREFGEPTGTLYSTGLPRDGYNVTANTGNSRSSGFAKARWAKQ